MKSKSFKKPELSVIRFAACDVIATSTPEPPDNPFELPEDETAFGNSTN